MAWGKQAVNIAPFFGTLSITSRPRWRLRICFTSDNPVRCRPARGCRRIDPVEPLGQPRQVLRCDAGAEVADHDPDFRRASLDAAGVRETITRPPAAPYLSAFSIRFSNSRKSSSRSPRSRGAPGSSISIATWRPWRAAPARRRPGESAARNRPARRAGHGPTVDPRQRQQIVDQPRHPGHLRMHDAEEALARLGIVAGRALQRIDEAGHAASGVRSSWLALATKSARISSTRRSGVRSWNVISMHSRCRRTPWHRPAR